MTKLNKAPGRAPVQEIDRIKPATFNISDGNLAVIDADIERIKIKDGLNKLARGKWLEETHPIFKAKK